MNVFDEFPKITKAIEEKDIKYALVGGVALAFHDQPRFTKDIDIILGPNDFEKITEILLNLGYDENSPPWTFRSTKITLHRFTKIQAEEYLVLDILVGHESRHKEIIDNALMAESDEGEIRVARKEDLIWLKQQRNSDQDKVDIKNLRDEKD